MSIHENELEPDFSLNFVIPERSQLFSLQPSGVGTAHQESLLSLLVQLSHAHAVNPRLLIKKVCTAVDPAIEGITTAAFFQRLAGTINGLGQYAETFVSTIEKLTGQSNLHHLTLLPWKSLFPHNGQGLLARQPRWCPVCLDEQFQKHGEAAFPLIWSLETYQICHAHQVALEYCCSSCGKAQPFIPAYPNLALCAYCRHPLGGARRNTVIPHFQVWVSEALGKMVAHQSSHDFTPTLGRFHEFVREQVKLHTDGNRAAFCRAIGMNEFGVSGWLNKGERPSITQFLTVCYGTSTWPEEVFLPTSQPIRTAELRMPVRKLKARADLPRLSPARRITLEKILQGHLNTGSGQSVSVIAQSLGVGRSCLHYWFPDLCKLLSERHRTMAMRQSNDRHRQQCMLVEEVISRIHAEGGTPTKRKVDKLLRTKGISLSQPHLIGTYREFLALKNG